MSEPRLDVTVAICTRNRAGPLGVMLDSILRLEVPEGLAWELLIVDNGSTDETEAVIRSYADRLPVRYACEPEAGLSNARNCAVREARGRYICWTDDDVELDPSWLSAYADAFRRHPEAALFGGQIDPVIQGPSPEWFTRLAHLWPIADIVVARNFGEREIPLSFDNGVIPWGANYAVRTDDQRRFSYDPKLGVSPVQRRSGEESEMMFQLMREGATGWWIPSAKVRHLYPPSRQTYRYFFKHFVAIGETWAYLQDTRAVHCMNRNGAKHSMVTSPIPWLYFRAGVEAVLFAGFHVLGFLGFTRRSLYYLRKLGMYWGAAAYRRQAARRPRAATVSAEAVAG